MRIATLLTVSLLVASPALAQTPPTEAAPVAPEAEATVAPPSDWRIVPDENLLVIDTSRGRILVEMTPEIAPGHVERMRLLARGNFFDGQAWHRVIDWFMAQTGDPLGTGDGQSPYPDLTAEFTFRRGPDLPFTAVAAPAGRLSGFVHSLPVETQPDELMAHTEDGRVHGWGVYCPGVAGMARDEDADSANSQFFLMRQPYPSLDKRYTVWGRVVSGLEVVRALKSGENADGLVDGPDRMERVRIAADLPEGERPTVRVMSTTAQPFRDLVERTRAARGADFSVCDIELTVDVSDPAALSPPPPPPAAQPST